MMLKWVASSGDRKPDFTIDKVVAGDKVNLQIAGRTSFAGQIYNYYIPVGTSDDISFAEVALAKGTWYARASINGGPWLLSGAFKIT